MKISSCRLRRFFKMHLEKMRGQVGAAFENKEERQKEEAMHIEAFTHSDWKVIMFCSKAIEPYNQEYKKKNDYDYYGEGYKFLVEQAKAYWQKRSEAHLQTTYLSSFWLILPTVILLVWLRNALLKG
jgi:hypothetical protein